MRFSDNNKDNYQQIRNNITMKNLEKIMDKKKISDVMLGNELFLSSSSIQGYRYNTKYPSLVSLVKMADYFNVNIDFLLDRTDIPTKIDNLLKYSSQDYNDFVMLYDKLSKEEKSNVIGYINGILSSRKN